MTGDFSKCMIIPKKFIEHFTGELLETVELQVPSGDVWHVELKKTKDGVALDCGWKNFVEAYGILENDTLIFNYNGCSSFLVLIFEQSGCEKAVAYCTKKRGPMDNLWPTPHAKTARPSCNVSSYRHTEQEQHLTAHHYSRSNRKSKVSHIREMENSKRSYRRKKLTFHLKEKKTAKEHESSINKGIERPANETSLVKQCSPNIFFISSKRTALNATEIDERISFAEMVQTNKPCFVTTMVPCSIFKRFYMAIPTAFAAEYLPRTTTEVILKLPGMEWCWEVQCYVWLKSAGLNKGWKEFACDNKLKVGDICLFELAEAQKAISFIVHIRRVEGEPMLP